MSPIGSSITRAVLLALAADGVLSFMDVLIKGLTARYSTFMIAFLRFAMGTLVAGALFAWMRPGWPNRESAIANGVRSVVIAVTATTFFYALGMLPLADCAALTFLAPVFTVLFGAMLLGERVDLRIVLAIVLGFVGMVVMVGGQTSLGSLEGPAVWGAAAAVTSALAYALNVVILRQRAMRDPLPTIVLFQNVGPAVLLALPAWLVWQVPAAADLALFALIAVLGVGGHYLLAKAFSMAEAAKLAPVEYTVLLWAALFGFVFFGEVPSSATVAGALLIVVGTLLIGRR